MAIQVHTIISIFTLCILRWGCITPSPKYANYGSSDDVDNQADGGAGFANIVCAPKIEPGSHYLITLPKTHPGCRKKSNSLIIAPDNT